MENFACKTGFSVFSRIQANDLAIDGMNLERWFIACSGDGQPRTPKFLFSTFFLGDDLLTSRYPRLNTAGAISERDLNGPMLVFLIPISGLGKSETITSRRALLNSL